jgi:hypothetical protein
MPNYYLIKISLFLSFITTFSAIGFLSAEAQNGEQNTIEIYIGGKKYHSMEEYRKFKRETQLKELSDKTSSIPQGIYFKEEVKDIVANLMQTLPGLASLGFSENELTKIFQNFTQSKNLPSEEKKTTTPHTIEVESNSTVKRPPHSPSFLSDSPLQEDSSSPSEKKNTAQEKKDPPDL